MNQEVRKKHRLASNLGVVILGLIETKGFDEIIPAKVTWVVNKFCR